MAKLYINWWLKIITVCMEFMRDIIMILIIRFPFIVWVFCRFSGFNGSLLLEHKAMVNNSPDLFYASVKTELNLTLVQTLKYAKAIKQLQWCRLFRRVSPWAGNGVVKGVPGDEAMDFTPTHLSTGWKVCLYQYIVKMRISRIWIRNEKCNFILSHPWTAKTVYDTVIDINQELYNLHADSVNIT